MARKKQRPMYALFDACQTEASVQANFERSFNRTPEQVFQTGGGWLAGPLSPKEIDLRARRGEVHYDALI